MSLKEQALPVHDDLDVSDAGTFMDVFDAGTNNAVRVEHGTKGGSWGYYVADDSIADDSDDAVVEVLDV